MALFATDYSLGFLGLRDGRWKFIYELESGQFSKWRDLTPEEIVDAGQHEILNWVCLAGALHELNYRPDFVDYAESYVFNSDKCMAVFSAGERVRA